MVESTSADRGFPPLSMVPAKYAQSQSETSPQCCSLFCGLLRLIRLDLGE